MHPNTQKVVIGSDMALIQKRPQDLFNEIIFGPVMMVKVIGLWTIGSDIPIYLISKRQYTLKISQYTNILRDDIQISAEAIYQYTYSHE